jgi:serine/threonine protein kinase
VGVSSFEITPERFGRYVLLDRIGAGGMAEVFRAVMPGVEGFRRTFVVKRILAARARSADFVEMFVQEARIGALLNHPNIVQVYDFGNVDGNYFLAMEYLRGRDLSALMHRLRDRQRPLPIPVAAFIAREVAESLAYAHALTDPEGNPLNVVHRDVSSSNIMCIRAGGVKLLDFGIAKAIGTAVEQTGHGVFKGKLSYMAPERIKDEAFDGRSDLFSLGVVLWEILTGRRLFRGPTEADTLKNALQMRVPAPSTLRPEVPAALDAIVLRALERDPEGRTPNGHEMADALEEVLAETRYHSKMLPTLLRELFGAELASSQIELTKLTPELLAACSGETSTASARPGTVEAQAGPIDISVGNLIGSGPIDNPPHSSRSPRARVALLLGIAAAAAIGGVLLARAKPRPVEVAHAPVGETISAPGSVALSPAPVPASVRPPPTAAQVVTAAPPADRALPVKTLAATRSHGRRPADGDRIARGLSIDPFAEAGTREAR